MPPVAIARHSAVIVPDQHSVTDRPGRSVIVLPVVDSAATVTAQAATSAAMAMPPVRSVTVRHVQASAGIAPLVVDSAATATDRHSAVIVPHVAMTMHHVVTSVIAHGHASAHNPVVR
jgi:hypothetical protein